MRLVLGVCLLVTGGLVVGGAVAGGSADNQITGGPLGPAENLTVVGSDGWGVSGDRATAELAVFGSDGEGATRITGRDGYLDVDPVENTTHTVVYLTHSELQQRECGGADTCTRVRIVRRNLSTGRVRVVYQTVTPGVKGTRWHDADRINETHYVIADIRLDRVFVLDVETGIREWGWDASTEYNRSSGGVWPDDWTHLNDVEVLSDGRVMVSLRNQDQVVFVDRENGVQRNWTLGADDDHGVLYEQHNPDYIPESRGGPAVLVADSENNRIVEYQRRDGEWVQSWVWADDRLTWPRDADRLPNGHTLVTDSNGNRVIEVNESGAVVWTGHIGLPYEAERLGTGDESAGGPSAVRAGLSSQTAAGTTDYRANPGLNTRIKNTLELLFVPLVVLAPQWVASGVQFLLPVWWGIYQSTAVVVSFVVSVVWLAVEYREATVSVRSPIVRNG